MILGLTGAFGGGKSTVLDYFKQKNWQIFDADAECRKLYSSGTPELISAVRTIFGSSALDDNGNVVKEEISRQAFETPDKMKKLTAVIYPLLNAVLNRQIKQCREANIAAVFEIPLLYEENYQELFDAILAIWTEPEVRCERLKKRNFSREDMIARDARQLDPVQKLENADFAVINNGSTAMLYAQLDQFIRQIQN